MRIYQLVVSMQDLKVKFESKYNHAVGRYCLICSVNFEIPPSFILLIELKEGVEYVTKSTRYEIVVMVGKLFTVESVEQEIRRIVDNWYEEPAGEKI